MNCRICGNDKGNTHHEAREMMFGTNEAFQYFQCSECGCLQIAELPASMEKYYPADYYSYQINAGNNKFKTFMRNRKTKLALFGSPFIKSIFKIKPNKSLYFLSLIPLREDTSILDVGCGAGHLLLSLREIGMEKLLGIDPFNPQDIKYENGLMIKKMDLSAVDGRWDIVMLHHSFEHMPDPSEILQIVSRLLVPNGCCVIRIPVASSYAWNHYGVNWVQLDAPRHFHLHSIASMKILAQRAGLETCKVVYDSTAFQFWGSEQYLKGISLVDKRSYSKNSRDSIFSKEDISVFTARANELNDRKEGDQAIFYLKKTSAH